MLLLSKYLKKHIKVDDVKKHEFKFLQQIKNQIIQHKKNCSSFSKFINNLNIKFKELTKLENIPFLHVNAFKENELYSIKKKNIYKILNSSGTTNQKLSKIYLDKVNAKSQILVLKKILQSTLGEKRLPMLIFEKNPNLINKSKFGAKIAAILGFSIFGKNLTFAINFKNEIDYKAVNNFLKNFSKEKFLVFGFTSSIYEFLIKKINTKKLYNFFENSILLHGGGWKKLEKIKIDNNIFKKKLKDKLKIAHVINYYGVVEQTGSIFLECEKCKCFHNNIFNNIIIRDKKLNPIKDYKKKGIIQIQSLIPSSYPGNSILLEDEGYYIKKNNKNCLNTGKSFKIAGRIPRAEVRGCSDA